MTTTITGQQYYIGAGSYRATVTGLGAGLRALVFGAQPVIDGYGANELPADPRARRDDHAYLGYSGIPRQPPPEEG